MRSTTTAEGIDPGAQWVRIRRGDPFLRVISVEHMGARIRLVTVSRKTGEPVSRDLPLEQPVTWRLT